MLIRQSRLIACLVCVTWVSSSAYAGQPTAAVPPLGESAAHQRASQAVAQALKNTKKISVVDTQAVLRYLTHGVKGIKRPRDPLYDRADALVAALGALPHVALGFREVPSWATSSSRWNAAAGDEQIEGTFVCVE